MIGVTVKGAQAVAAKLKAAETELRAAQDRGVALASAQVERALKTELTGAERRDVFWGRLGAAGNQLGVRSGHTRQSITGGGKVYRVGHLVTAAVGSAEKHLKLHEDGGTVKGTSPKGFARIPTAAAQTGAGVDRWLGTSIRNIPGAFLVRTMAGRLWAAMRNGKGPVVLLYLLVRQTLHRPRKIFARTAEAQKPVVDKLIGAQIAVAVAKANA